MHLRHVWRELNDGNGDVKVLALQQFNVADDWEDEAWRQRQFDKQVQAYGFWEDIPVDNKE
jgi:hypothetical protein